VATLLRNRPRVLTRTLAGLFVALAVGTAHAGYAATSFLDAVLAEADGAVVTASDVAIGKALGLFGLEASPASIHTADVQRLVDARLVIAEADRLQIAPSPSDVEEAWSAVAARLGGADVLRSWLDQAGLDEAWVRRLVEADLRWRRFIEVRFRAFAFVTEEDVTKAIGPGPHTPDAREKAVNVLREEITRRELTAWLAEARSRAAIRTTGAEGTGLPSPFPLPKRAGAPAAALP
jgi:hypothetical protein